MPAADPVHIPEVIEPDDKLPADLVALRRFAFLLDEAIAVPGTKFRIGLDPLIGLIPGIGDALGALLSAWIIIGALRHRVPVRKILRMIFNVFLDALIGAFPVFGDIADFLFEENVMNLRILMQHRNRALPPRRMGAIALQAILITIVLVIIALIPIFVLVTAVFWLIGNRGAI